MESLVAGLSCSLLIPKDIINLIELFYSNGISWDVYLCLGDNPSMKLYNVASNKKYDIISSMGDKWFNSYRVSNDLNTTFIANHCDLPQYFANHLAKKQLDNIPRHNWSISFHFDNGYPFNACAKLFNASLISSNPSERSQCYQFKLMPLQNIWENRPSMSYSSERQIMYLTNVRENEEITKQGATYPGFRSVWQLDLNHTEKPIQGFLGHLTINRYSTCTCLVDNNRFICVIGGIDRYSRTHCNNVELFAIDCRKSIEIKGVEYEFHDRSSRCIYHKEYHKIIICNKHARLDAYDINKDKWMLINADLDCECMDNKFERIHWKDAIMQQLWINEEDPCLIMRSISTWRGAKMQQFDIRVNGKKQIWSSDDLDFYIRDTPLLLRM